MVEGTIGVKSPITGTRKIKIHNSPKFELTISFDGLQGKVNKNYSVPSWTVEDVVSNNTKETFRIRKSSSEFYTDWLKTETSEYSVYNGNESSQTYSFKDGDYIVRNRRGIIGEVKIKLNDGSVFSYDRRKETYILKHPDGSYYSGTFLGNEDFNLNSTNADIPAFRRNFENRFSSADLKYNNGVLTMPNGNTIKYSSGESEVDINRRRLQEEQAEQEAYQRQQRQEKAKAQARHEELVRHFGARTAKAIEDDEPYIGMPEAAFNEIDGNYRVYEQNTNGTVYSRISWFKNNRYYKDGFIAGYIVCQNGRIVKIINL